MARQFAAVVAVIAGSVLSPSAASQTSRPYLGVFGEDPATATVRDGALVREVVNGGPAAQAGLQAGDVIVRAANRPIRTFSELADIVRMTTVGSTLPITVRRDGGETTLTATLGPAPGDVGAPTGPIRVPTNMAPRGPRPMVGVITRQAPAAVELPNGTRGGAYIAEVDLTGAAARAGLLTGDIVVKVDDRLIPDPRAFSESVLAKRPGDVLKIEVVRGAERIVKDVKLDQAPGGLTVPGGVIEGPAELIRSQQVDELQQRVQVLEARVRELEGKLKEANDRATSPPQTPAPRPKPAPVSPVAPKK